MPARLRFGPTSRAVASITTNDWGVWSEASGSLALVARSGSPAPGTPAGVNFDSFLIQSGFNNAGQTAFFAFVTGSGVDPSNDQGIWSEGSGSLGAWWPAAAARHPAHRAASLSRILSSGGDSTMRARRRLKPSLPAMASTTPTTKVSGRRGSGALALVARRGSPGPGTPNGVNFDAFSLASWPVLNDRWTKSRFAANLTGTGVTFSNTEGIWLGSADDLTLVARTGDPAPGTASGDPLQRLVSPDTEQRRTDSVSCNSHRQRAYHPATTWASGRPIEPARFSSSPAPATQLEVAPGVFRTISDLAFVGDTGNSDGRASGFNNSRPARLLGTVYRRHARAFLCQT